MNSLTRTRPVSLALSLAICLGFTAAARAQVTYLTDFTKDNNIYTDLNEEFPHTGTGTPGSGVGTANSSFLFDPNPSAVATAGYAPDYVSGSNLVNNGIDFTLTSDSSGHDYEEFGSNSGTPTSVTVTADVNKVSNVYALVGAYYGVDIDVTFTGANGDTQVFNNISVPNFVYGSINTTGAGYADQTLFQVDDTGGGGSGNSTTGYSADYDLTELSFTLDSELSSQELTSITFFTDSDEGLLFAVTTPEPSTWAMLAGGLGLLFFWRRRTFST
jgi:hypothetical protein